MSDLDEAGRTLIALASDAHDPTDEDRGRVRSALAARLGGAAGLGVGVGVGVGTVAGLTAKAQAAASVGGVASTGGATAAVTGGALATKLVGVAVALTLTVGAGATVKLARRSAHAPVAVTKSASHGHRTPAAAPREQPAPESEQAGREDPSSQTPAGGPAPGDEAPAVPPTRPSGANARAKIDTRDVPPPAPRRRSVISTGAGEQARAQAPAGTDVAARRSESAVADEARLVHDGVRALREGQPAHALSLFDRHARLYPQGVLAEERDGERALALADLGQVAEARAAAAAFLRRHPASPLGMRLRQRIPGLDVAE